MLLNMSSKFQLLNKHHGYLLEYQIYIWSAFREVSTFLPKKTLLAQEE